MARDKRVCSVEEPKLSIAELDTDSDVVLLLSSFTAACVVQEPVS